MKASTIQMLSNRKVNKIFYYGLACTYSFLLVLHVMLAQYKGIVVVAILIALYIARHSSPVLNHPRYQLFAAVSPFFEIVLLFFLFLQSPTEIENIVLVLFVADLLLVYKSWYALSFAYSGYIAYTFLWPVQTEEIWRQVFDALSYICLVLAIWSMKLLFNQRDISSRLNSALIQEAKAREELAALRERTRIAEEVHDTVGHTLTTAIVALEGAQMIFEARPDEALRKIHVAQVQLKQGLGNIRQVVRTLKAKDGTEGDLELEEGILKIMADTAKQTGVHCTLDYNLSVRPISLQKYVIINLTKESITNALKHGNASRIEVSVVERQETIDVKVKDNGTGCASVAYGFGLKSMENRVNAIGGHLSVHSEVGKGCTLHVQMPIARGEE